MASYLLCVLQLTRQMLLELATGVLSVPERRGGVSVLSPEAVTSALAACAPLCALLMAGNTAWQGDLLCRAGACVHPRTMLPTRLV